MGNIIKDFERAAQYFKDSLDRQLEYDDTIDADSFDELVERFDELVERMEEDMFKELRIPKNFLKR